MLHWSFFLVLLGTVARQASAVNIRTMCNGYSSGTLLPNPQDCNSYYVCQSGPQLAYCDYGLHFDRVHKVCNWPDWANCKLEEVDDDNLIVDHIEGMPEEEELADPIKPELNEEKPTEELKEPIQSESGEGKLEVKPDLKEDKPKEEIKDPIQSNSGEGKPETPFHTPLSKEPIDDESDNEVIKSNGVGQLIASSLSKNPNSKDKAPVEKETIKIPDSKPETDHVLVVNVPVASSNESQKFPHVIEVPVVVPAQNADFGTASDPKPSSNSTLAIQVPVVVPTEILNPEESQPSTNSTQVVQVPIAVPGDIPNSPIDEIVDETSNNIEQIPEPVEKVETSNPSKNQAQVIELAAPVLPVHVLTPNEDIAVVSPEKVDTSKPSQSTNQIIELSVPANPLVIPNTNIDNSNPPQVEVAVEKLEKPTETKPVKNPTQVIDLPVFAGGDIVIPVARPEVGKVDTWTSVKEHQDISISSSEENPAKKAESSSEEDSSLSSESDQSSEEDLNLKPAKQSEKNSVKEKVEEASSEEEPVREIEKVVIDHGKDSAQSSEENLVQSPQQNAESVEASINHKGSPESSEENILKPGHSTHAHEHNATSDSVESSEEDVLEPLHHIHAGQGTVSKVEVSTDKVSAESVNKPHHQSGVNEVDSEEHNGSPESSEENVLKPDQSGVSQEHKTLPDSVESSEEDVLIPTHHIFPGQNILNKVEVSIDPQTDKVTADALEGFILYHENSIEEEKDSFESSEENGLISNHHYHLNHVLKPSDHHQSSIEGSKDSQSSEDIQAFEGALFQQYKPIHKVENPTSLETLKEHSGEFPEDILHHLPTPHVGHKNDKPLTPVGKPITPEAEANLTPSHSNLIVSILSVASFQGNSSGNATINRPIVGAHSTETGHPIDVMTGYSSKNVQCIHNGLYFLPHPSNCQKYFICAYHHLHLHSCGNYLIWNYKREQCEVGSDSRCYSRERVLEERPKPQKPAKPDREEQVEEIIPETDAPLTSTPMPPLRTTKAAEPTVSRDSMIPKCTTLRQVYMASYDDCNKYYICILGEPVLTSCPDNMHWDAKGEFCGNPTEAKCVRE